MVLPFHERALMVLSWENVCSQMGSSARNGHTIEENAREEEIHDERVPQSILLYVLSSLRVLRARVRDSSVPQMEEPHGPIQIAVKLACGVRSFSFLDHVTHHHHVETSMYRCVLLFRGHVPPVLPVHNTSRSRHMQILVKPTQLVQSSCRRAHVTHKACVRKKRVSARMEV